jgi:hypothetical protein
MSATTAQQLVDANGHIIVDQYYDDVTDKYLPGSNPSGAGGGGSTTFCDQIIIAAGGTAVAFPSHAIKNGAIVKSFAGNSALRQTTAPNSAVTNAVAGASGANAGYILEPGEAAPYSVSSTVTNANQIYCNGQTGDIFTIIGS